MLKNSIFFCQEQNNLTINNLAVVYKIGRKKNSKSVSRVLYTDKSGFLSFLQAHCYQGAQSTYPPTLDEQPSASVYLVFQPMRYTAVNITTNTGELLPHLFTLIANKLRRLFSVALLYPHKHLPVRKHGALCCPDFPLFLIKETAIERLAIFYKINLYLLFSEI